MPSFASFTHKPLAVGKGKDHPKSYPPVSMKAPYLPETPHLDTSDLLVSVQSVSSPSVMDASRDSKNNSRPSSRSRSGQKGEPYAQRDTGFVGGHQYKIERQEERRRLRSLGLLTGTSTPQSETPNPQSPTMSTPTSQKPDSRRRSSWQPPLKGKLQKRNKSREPEQRKSIDIKHASIDFHAIAPPLPPPQPVPQQTHSFSRIQNYPASPMASPCATPSSMTPTRDRPPPIPSFSNAGRSNSSLGTVLGAASTHSPSSLGNLVDFYDPNSPGLGQAFSTAPSSPIVPLPLQTQSSQTASPIGFHRPRYTTQAESPNDSVASSPRLAPQPIPPPPPAANPTSKSQIPPFPAPLMTPPPSTSCGNSSTTSLNSSTSQTPTEKQPEKSGFKPYQPKYAAKSHVTSTAPLSHSINQEPIGTPFVHLDFAPPAKPFARSTGENRRSTSETRLTTQEAKEYNAIAQATREAYYNRIQSPSETSLSSKSPARPQLTPSRLSYEVRSSPNPESQALKASIPPKSILRKPLELAVENIQETKEENQRPQTSYQSVESSTVPTPEPLKLMSAVPTPAKSEPVSPIEPTEEPELQPERGRSMFKRGEETPNSDISRRNSMSARKSIDIETPSAKNFDISKYTQERFSKHPPSPKAQKSYPPVSYKSPVPENSSTNTEPPTPNTHIPPVPPLPESMQSIRGLSTPPPIRSETAIESSDEESLERPSTASESKKAGKSKLGSNVTTAESAPVRPRAPSMSEILKDFIRHDLDDGISPEPTEATDWLSQLFRGKKHDSKTRSRPVSGISTPGSSASPPLGKPAKKEKDHRRTPSRELTGLTEEGRRVHERAERQRLQLERKLMEAENDLASTPRSPRFPRGSLSVTASPDLRIPGTDASSLRSTSTTSVDRLDPVHLSSASLALGRTDDLASDFKISLDEKKPQEHKRRPSSAEVRKQLGEMTPPHEREDWETVRNSQGSFTTLSFPQPQIPPHATPPTPASPSIPPAAPVVQPVIQPVVQPLVQPVQPVVQPYVQPIIKPVPGRLPVAADPLPSKASSSRVKEPLGLEHRASNSSLISLDVTKTLTKILVVCCSCNRLHDPPSDIYRKMAGGNSSFRCPYCVHPINVLECCSAYTSICNLIEKLN